MHCRPFVSSLALLLLALFSLSSLPALAAVPGAPTGQGIKPGHAEVILSWTAPSGPVISYNVYRGTVSGNESLTPLVTGLTSTTYTDTGLTNGQAYYYKVSAVNASGEGLKSAEAAQTPNIHINAGGSSYYPDSVGVYWAAEPGTSGGTPISTTSAIANTSGNDHLLYQAQEEGTTLTYSLPVQAGSYKLTLQFAEIGTYTRGQRVFNVTANGRQVATNYDIFAAAGGADKAVSVTATITIPVTIPATPFTLTLTGVTGPAAIAAFSLAPPTAAAADVPPPGWAADMVPTDEADAGGLGPSASERVVLPSGVKENAPGPDVWAYNAIGPSVSYERFYRSSRAAANTNAPSLSPGWTDNYDFTVTAGNPGTWGPLTLTWPSGAQEVWTPVLSGGMPTGAFTVPSGLPYFVTGVASGTTGQWNTLTMTMKDHSQDTFTPVSLPVNTYLLTQMTNLVGHYVSISRDTSANGNRLLSIANDAPTPVTLLAFAYNGTQLLSVADMAGSGRQVNYAFTGASLAGVSYLDALHSTYNSTNRRWLYGYQTINQRSYLSSVKVPNPASLGGFSQATTIYDTHGAVNTLTDANGHQRGYIFGGTGVGLTIYDASGNPTMSLTQRFGTRNVDTGFTDALGKTASMTYGDGANPYQPTQITNRNYNAANPTYQSVPLTYDSFGNTLTAQDPQGTTVTDMYQYTAFPLGQLQQTQTTNGTSSLQATTFDYYSNGLLEDIYSPVPGTIGGTSTETTTYTYDALGNVTQVTTPGPNSTLGTPSTYTTIKYDYMTGYNGYTQAEALGEPTTVTVSGPAYGGGSTTTTVTYYEYDALGNRLFVTDALGNRTGFAYNIADQMTEVDYPSTGQTGPMSGHSHEVTAYQYPGGPVSTESLYDEGNVGLVRQTTYTYGPEGELLSVKDQKGLLESYQYDALYRQSAVLDGLNQATLYDYDTVGNLLRVRYPLMGGTSPGSKDTETYTYDADGNLSIRTDGNGVHTTYTRDPKDSRLTGITYPTGHGSSNVSFTYDAFERMNGLSNGEVAKTYAFDDLSEMTNSSVSFLPMTSTPQGQGMTYAYNPDGSRNTLTFSQTIGTSGLFSYQYDGFGQLTQANFPWTDGFANYTYFTNGTTGNTQPGWLKTTQTRWFKTTYAYTNLGQPYVIVNYWEDSTHPSNLSELAYFKLNFDAADNRTSNSAYFPSENGAPEASRSQTWVYDARDEVTEDKSVLSDDGSSVYNDVYDNFFTFDAAYNPKGFRVTSSGATNAAFNADNQNSDLAHFTYDGQGRPTSYQSASTNFTFDVEGRLTAIASPAFSATYAPDDKRASKTVSSGTT